MLMGLGITAKTHHRYRLLAVHAEKLLACFHTEDTFSVIAKMHFGNPLKRRCIIAVSYREEHVYFRRPRVACRKQACYRVRAGRYDAHFVTEIVPQMKQEADSGGHLINLGRQRPQVIDCFHL